MRLLNTKKIVPEAFPNPKTPYIPDYAILSHRWGKTEVSLQEIENPSQELCDTVGYQKVKRCCEQAASVGFDYVWIDTCCIDKRNNVELTEALNSMFQWYRDSRVCYSYLDDVPSSDEPRSEDSRFRQSRWFTRGWTLQELLAPLYVVFFGSDWTEIGTKSSLQEVISDITGVDSQVLLTNYSGEISVAQRMAWASKRETARVEDEAYCLMGLFGVNMPMLYGEGNNAFIRLQLEIIKLSDDQSIFAWSGYNQQGGRGLLASSPKEFVNCSNVRRYGDDSQTSAFSMTNKGLHIELPLIPCGNPSEENLFQAVLACQRKQGAGYRDRYPLGIYLQRDQGEHATNYVRVKADKIEEIKNPFAFHDKSELYVREKNTSKFDVVQWMQPQDRYNFSIKKRPRGRPHVKQDRDTKWEISDDEIRSMFERSGHSGILLFKDKGGQVFAVVLGVHNYNVWCDIATDCGHDDIEKLAREYWDGVKYLARWKNLDRRVVPLPEGYSVSLAIKQGQISGQRACLIEISTDGDYRLDKVGPGCCWEGWPGYFGSV